jgi:ubiquinone/menaquinone biosynthesis C-methylase UbiE
MESPRSTASYHQAELKIALDRSHPSHILPPPLPIGQVVMDIGCGAGQTLIAAYPDRVSFGVDIDQGALELGRSLTDNVRFVRARAERLPWSDARFDLVTSRVSLSYTDMSASLREIHRVLRPGGKIWMTLHPLSLVWNQAKRGNYKGWIFFLYILLNSAMFHFTGKQCPFVGRFESFQTEYGMLKALKKSGFDDIHVDRGQHFVITARKS